MELTVREWAEYMEEPYKSKFKHYIDTIPREDNMKTYYSSLDQAIMKGFTWSKTAEGPDFWQKIYKKYQTGELKPIDPVAEYQIF